LFVHFRRKLLGGYLGRGRGRKEIGTRGGILLKRETGQKADNA